MLLTGKIIFIVSIILIVMILIVIVNIQLFVKHKPGFSLSFLHVASVLSEAILFCILMQVEIIPLYLKKQYFLVLLIFSMIFLILMVSRFFVGLFFSKKKSLERKLSPNLKTIMDQMDDAIFILDYEENFIYSNLKAQHLHIEVKKIIQNIDLNEKSEQKIQNQTYQVSKKMMIRQTGKKKRILGSYIILHNIQEEIDLQEALKQSNHELMEMNQTLTKNLKIENELVEEKERLRLVQELQDSIIQKIEQVTVDVESFKNKVELKKLAEKNLEHNITTEELDGYTLFFNEVGNRLRWVFKEVRESIIRLSKK